MEYFQIQPPSQQDQFATIRKQDMHVKIPEHRAEAEAPSWITDTEID